MRSLFIFIFLYGCELWALTAELEKRTQAFEMRYCRRLLSISYKDNVTNEDVLKKSKQPLEKMTNSGPWSRNGNLGGFWLSKNNSAGHSARKKKER